MTRKEIKGKLEALLEILPDDKAEAVLDFAEFLQHQVGTQLPAAEEEWDDWDRAIIAAEEYWFSLSEETRHAYIGRTAAVVEGRILDADSDRMALEERVRAQYPDLPVLYVEGEAEQFKPLVVLSPHLR